MVKIRLPRDPLYLSLWWKYFSKVYIHSPALILNMRRLAWHSTDPRTYKSKNIFDNSLFLFPPKNRYFYERKFVSCVLINWGFDIFLLLLFTWYHRMRCDHNIRSLWVTVAHEVSYISGLIFPRFCAASPHENQMMKEIF